MPSLRRMLLMQIRDIGNLFPSKLHAVIFVAYMGLFINQGILVTATKSKDNTFPYNPTTTVLLSEFLKFLTACCLHSHSTSVSQLWQSVNENRKVLLLYLIPSFLYCLYNNLAFVNLSAYDPTTYYVLLQFRTVVTGVIFQVLFNKRLSLAQWFSLFLLTMGCIVKQLKSDGGVANIFSSLSISFDIHLVFILVQVFCSCFAGVYNEYLLKGKGGDTPFMVQNVFMYLDSMLCNVIVLGFTGHLRDSLTAKSISSILQVKVVAIIFNNAAIGIVTALFLRSLNSILKTFASALELVFTAILCWIIFGIEINIFTILALIIVTIATVVYAQNPVDNTPKQDQPQEKGAGNV